MGELFFQFRDYDTEIEAKMISQSISSSVMASEFYQFLIDFGLGPQEISRTQELFSRYLAGTAFDREKPHYLSHPIRVTAAYLGCLKHAGYEEISLGLCHNLKEKSGEQFRHAIPDHFLSEPNKQKIEMLTIDRNQEKEPEYLTSFYDAITCDPHVLLLKSLDKLDNTLIWPLLDLDPYHAQIVLNFVCPRIQKSHSRLAEYLIGLTQYVVRPDVKAKFRELNQSQAFRRKTQQAREVRS